jgi:hypothetical protein
MTADKITQHPQTDQDQSVFRERLRRRTTSLFGSKRREYLQIVNL